jgi:hypothetical protein
MENKKVPHHCNRACDKSSQKKRPDVSHNQPLLQPLPLSFYFFLRPTSPASTPTNPSAQVTRHVHARRHATGRRQRQRAKQQQQRQRSEQGRSPKSSLDARNKRINHLNPIRTNRSTRQTWLSSDYLVNSTSCIMGNTTSHPHLALAWKLSRRTHNSPALTRQPGTGPTHTSAVAWSRRDAVASRVGDFFVESDPSGGGRLGGG